MPVKRRLQPRGECSAVCVDREYAESPSGRGKEKAASRMEARPVSIDRHQKTYPDPSTGSDSVKYMQKVDIWFDDLFPRAEKKLMLITGNEFGTASKGNWLSRFGMGRSSLQSDWTLRKIAGHFYNF